MSCGELQADDADEQQANKDEPCRRHRLPPGRAAVKAIAALAREPVPAEVTAAYNGRELAFGPEYIIPTPFDPRLIVRVPVAVAQAAMESGVARKPLADVEVYKKILAGKLGA